MAAEMIVLLQTDLAQDLSALTTAFWQRRIVHRVVEQEGQQLLILGDESQFEQARQLIEAWQSGELLPDQKVETDVSGVFAQLLKAPLTVALLLMMGLVALHTQLGATQAVLYYLILPEQDLSSSLPALDLLLSSPGWRWISPVFLHFGAIHLIFNGLWLWEMGKKIEAAGFVWILLALVIITGLASNIAQLIVTGPVFGGMSGVIYGLLAYGWLAGRFYPLRDLSLPSVIVNFMLIWLLLGFTGFSEVIGLGKMANTAHLVGLLSGLVFALVERLIRGKTAQI